MPTDPTPRAVVFPLTRFEAQRVVAEFEDRWHKDHACMVCCEDPISLAGDNGASRFVCLKHRLKAWLMNPNEVSNG